MAIARETVRLGLAARGQAKLKVRQPLRAAVVVATGEERAAIERMAPVVRDELNVKELRFVSASRRARRRSSSSPTTARSAHASASRCRWSRPRWPASTAARAAATLREGGKVAISVGGQDHELTAEDLQVSMKPLDGYQVEREGSHAVALELEIDDELRVEGWAREIVRAVQLARQEAGLEVSDRIAAHARRRPRSCSPRRAPTRSTSPARRSRSRSATSRSTTTSSPSRSTGASCGSASPCPADRLAPTARVRLAANSSDYASASSNSSNSQAPVRARRPAGADQLASSPGGELDD